MGEKTSKEAASIPPVRETNDNIGDNNYKDIVDDSDNISYEVPSPKSTASFVGISPSINGNNDKFIMFAAKLHNYADIPRSRVAFC